MRVSSWKLAVDVTVGDTRTLGWRKRGVRRAMCRGSGPAMNRMPWGVPAVAVIREKRVLSSPVSSGSGALGVKMG